MGPGKIIWDLIGILKRGAQITLNSGVRHHLFPKLGLGCQWVDLGATLPNVFIYIQEPPGGKGTDALISEI